MNIPERQHLVLAEAKVKTNPNFVDVWFSTEGAKTWLIEQIPKFSEDDSINEGIPYGLRVDDKVPGKAWFVVNKCFSVSEVVEYLNSYRSA